MAKSQHSSSLSKTLRYGSDDSEKLGLPEPRAPGAGLAMRDESCSSMGRVKIIGGRNGYKNDWGRCSL